MKFAEPYWLLVGVTACLLLWWRYRRFDRRQQATLHGFVAPRLAQQLTRSVSVARRTLKRALFTAGVACLFIALARPQAGYRWQETQRKGRDILFAVDTSRSMLAPDVKPNRLARAKLAVQDLLQHLDGDGVGLIAFAGRAFLQCPITLDYDAFRDSLTALDTTVIPRGGTDIASAIREAQATFKQRSDSDKILILLTDGEDLRGDAVAAAQAAGKAGVKIFTVGVGTPNGELIPLNGEEGGTQFVQDATGNYVKSRLDQATLTKIAQATGGMYQPLGQRDQGLTTIYEKGLAPFARHELATRRHKVYREQFAWALWAALAFFLADWFIRTRRRISLGMGTETVPGAFVGASPNILRTQNGVALLPGFNVTKPTGESTGRQRPVGILHRSRRRKEAEHAREMVGPPPHVGGYSGPGTSVSDRTHSTRSSHPPSAVAGLLLIFAAWPFAAHASTSRAEQEFQSGQYSQARQEYAAEAARTPGDAKLEFNLGAASYKTKDFTAAEKAFEQSIHTGPVSVQQDAYYNLGNTQYRLGQQAQKSNPHQTVQLWEHAIKSYDAALQIKPDDADARFNRELVERKLKQLKQQQQQKQEQQQQQKQGQNEPQHQKQQPAKSSENQKNSQSSQPKQASPKPSSSQPKPDQSSKPQQQSAATTAKPTEPKPEQTQSGGPATKSRSPCPRPIPCAASLAK